MKSLTPASEREPNCLLSKASPLNSSNDLGEELEYDAILVPLPAANIIAFVAIPIALSSNC
jgi:hypothetical protein